VLPSEEQRTGGGAGQRTTAFMGPGPAVADWRIVRETRAFQMCLQPARDQDSIYRPMIDDYSLKNKKTVVLQRRFKLSAYTLVLRSPQANLVTLRESLRLAQHVLEMFRRTLPDGRDRRLLDRLANRLTKITSETRHFGKG
jgi:hypothetical protein